MVRLAVAGLPLVRPAVAGERRGAEELRIAGAAPEVAAPAGMVRAPRTAGRAAATSVVRRFRERRSSAVAMSVSIEAHVRSHEFSARNVSALCRCSTTSVASACGARLKEPGCAVADLGQSRAAIRLDDVVDARARHAQPGGEVLGRLRGTDVARRVVVGERHDADVPAAEVGRQLLVPLHPEVVDVDPLRKARGIDLHDRPDHHELPIKATRGRRRDQVEVEALVDHAAVAESRVRDGGLVGRVDETPARLRGSGRRRRCSESNGRCVWPRRFAA